MSDIRFTYERMGFTETVCDTCNESILESEIRCETEDGIICEVCAKRGGVSFNHTTMNWLLGDEYIDTHEKENNDD